MPPMHDRIKAKLAERGLAASRASELSGQGKDFIRDLMRGKKESISFDAASKLAGVLGVDVNWLLHGGDEDMREPPDRYGGFAEPELVQLAPATAEQANALGPNTHHWRIGDSFAGLPGYRVGDVIEAEMGLEPRNRDDVLVQIEDRHGGASTVLRSFNKGFVWGAPGSDPEYVDGIRVRVVAVVRKSWRLRDGT